MPAAWLIVPSIDLPWRAAARRAAPRYGIATYATLYDGAGEPPRLLLGAAAPGCDDADGASIVSGERRPHGPSR
jgi:hypothetical protein